MLVTPARPHSCIFSILIRVIGCFTTHPPLRRAGAPRPLEAILVPLVAGPMQGWRSGRTWVRTWANRTGAIDNSGPEPRPRE